MASQASVASSQPDQRQLRLIAASAQANEKRVRDILAEDPPWTSDNDHTILRQALQKVAARGKLSLVRLLLEHGADVNTPSDKEIPAIFKAAEAGHTAVVSELLVHHADPNWRNKNGQTALFSACLRGHNKVVGALLDGGADVDILDKEDRSPLLFLASEKQSKQRWTNETLQLLLNKEANLEVKDQIGRTPLLWAVTNGKLELARLLLEGGANVAATNNRGRTALHLIAEGNDSKPREDIVRLLLDHGADPDAVSDGGWTPLHNAAQSRHLGIVELLLEHNANINSVLSNGMTPLHWAAHNGGEDIVRLILAKRTDVNLSIKDSFDRTPMLCAAENYHSEIVQLLSPARAAHRLSPLAERACRAFEATVVDFGQFRKEQLVRKYSVYDVLYGWNEDEDGDGGKPKVPTLSKNVKYKPDFRWIHLPANNIAWVETLLAKSFIEAGHRDIESFKALEKCFEQEHRGPLAHAHFMRTFCHRIPSPRSEYMAPERRDDSNNNNKPLTTLSEEQWKPSSEANRAGPGNSTTSNTNPNSQSGGDTSMSTPTRKTSSLQQQQSRPEEISDMPRSETPAAAQQKKKSRSEQLAERHPKKHKRGRGPSGNPPQRQPSIASSLSSSGTLPAPLAWETTKLSASNGKIVLFMPFLHYETDERRRKMTSAIKGAREKRRLVEDPSRDSLLVNAYMRNDPPLHPRRTLDQFFYHGIDTSARDTDQVVYRYCKRNHMETKVFMVDQLWLWILGKDLIITCFPQRWDQPKQDPLNVLDGIIEETNAKTRPPISSVYDLAMLISSRCSGMFDRHRLDDQNYQFLDMFEASIGVVTDRESRLFDRFNRASAQSAQWLQQHRQHRHRRMGRRGYLDVSSSSDDSDHDAADRFPDALLSIGVETSLLAEIKDIRDELSIIAVILDMQLSTVSDLEAFLIDEMRGGDAHHTGVAGGMGVTTNPAPSAPRRAVHNDPLVAEIRKRAREQRRGVEVRQKDTWRMDHQAASLYDSLTDLLDLKQKHSNALEARFAGDQAVIAAKQGQTIMVFTIVTIVFLPLSFIAAFFAINLREWQDEDDADVSWLTIGYVSRYMFGIGLAISIPLIAVAFTVTDIVDVTRGTWRRITGGNVRERSSKKKDRADKSATKRKKKKKSGRRKWLSSGTSSSTDENDEKQGPCDTEDEDEDKDGRHMNGDKTDRHVPPNTSMSSSGRLNRSADGPQARRISLGVGRGGDANGNLRQRHSREDDRRIRLSPVSASAGVGGATVAAGSAGGRRGSRSRRSASRPRNVSFSGGVAGDHAEKAGILWGIGGGGGGGRGGSRDRRRLSDDLESGIGGRGDDMGR